MPFAFFFSVLEKKMKEKDATNNEEKPQCPFFLLKKGNPNKNQIPRKLWQSADYEWKHCKTSKRISVDLLNVVDDDVCLFLWFKTCNHDNINTLTLICNSSPKDVFSSRFSIPKYGPTLIFKLKYLKFRLHFALQISFGVKKHFIKEKC